jgi:hypothetical protein
MTLQEVLTAAVGDLTANGFDSMDRVSHWLARIREAAVGELTSEADIASLLQRTLQQVYTRQVDQGGLARLNPGIERYTIEKLRPALRAELDRRIMASAQLIKMNRDAAIQRTLQRFSGWATSIPAGGSDVVDKVEVKQDIRKSMRQLPFSERRVAIDQGAKFASALSETAAVGTGAIAGIWHSNWRQPNYKYRRDHRERDEKIYAVRGNWAMERGLMNKGAGYTDDITKPAEEPFCFPGDSPIPYADGVRVAYRRWFDGELAVITTASGKTVRATPNHPVLTPDGWVAVGLLQEGDDVIEIAQQGVQALEQDQDHAAPLIADIFSTCMESGVAEMTRGKTQQFHGDGAQGDVEIVRPARQLSFGNHSSRPDRLQQFSLAVADLRRTTCRALQLFGHGGLRAATRVMCFSNQFAAPVFPLSGHSDAAGLRASAQFEAHCEQPSRECRTTDAESFGDCEKALPFAVTATKIIKVERRQWAGHVFNLETANGMYSVDGVVVHNCRCFYQWIYALRDLPSAMLTRKGAEELERVRIAIRTQSGAKPNG